MDGLIALVYARKLYDLAEGPQGPPGQDGEVTNAALEEKLESYAEVDGSYESMTVGNAEQLVSNVRVNDKTPYLFRTSGGSVDIGDREYVNGIVGGTVAWNQYVSNYEFANNSTIEKQGITIEYTEPNTFVIKAGSSATNNCYFVLTRIVGTLAIPAGHKILVTGLPRAFNTGTELFIDLDLGGASNQFGKNEIKSVANGTSNNNMLIDVFVRSGFTTSEDIVLKPQLFDLTKMFGSTIADYIYSLEQATAGAGVAFFRKLFPKDYYAYNAGELLSVSGLQSHDMTGFNQWDEEWELGAYNNDGEKVTNNAVIRSKNYIPVLPNTTYCFTALSGTDCRRAFYDADKNVISSTGGLPVNATFTTPSDAYYMNFNMPSNYGTTYKNDICINLHWDGSRDGEYEPYVKHSYPLDSSVVLRGVPKLDANNKLYYKGDTYEPDGTVTRKFGILTINGTTVSADGGWGITDDGNYACYKVFSGCLRLLGNFISPNFVWDGTHGHKAMSLYSFGGSSGASETITFILPSTVTNVTQANAWFAEHPTTVVYELATPTTETADPYQQVEIVSDFGTEEYVIDDNAFAIPVGHDTDYPVNLVAKLEMAPNSPEGNGDYIVRQTNGMNEYVPLVIEDSLPTIPSTAGSYKLTVTVAEGSDPVLSWEAE